MNQQITPVCDGEKKLAYCATPSRLANKIAEIMDFVTARGYGPLHPFQAFEYHRFEGGPIGRKATMEICCRSIDICDEFWMFGISEGTLIELEHVLSYNRMFPLARKTIKLFFEQFDPDWESTLENLTSKFIVGATWLRNNLKRPSKELPMDLLNVGGAESEIISSALRSLIRLTEHRRINWGNGIGAEYSTETTDHLKTMVNNTEIRIQRFDGTTFFFEMNQHTGTPYYKHMEWTFRDSSLFWTKKDLIFELADQLWSIALKSYKESRIEKSAHWVTQIAYA